MMTSTSNHSASEHEGRAGRGVLLLLGSSSGGVVRHVLQLASEIARLASPTTPIRIAGPVDHAAFFDRFSYVHVPIGARPHLRDLSNIILLRRELQTIGIVHAHGLRAGALAVLAARSLQRFRRPRLVVTLHNVAIGSPSTRVISRLLERIVARGADTIFGVSSDIVESAQTLGATSARRALVPAPNGFASPSRSAEKVRAELGIPEMTKIVLTVGRLAPQKGLDTLLEAAQTLEAVRRLQSRDAKTDFTWLVAGAGPRRADLAKQIAAKNLPVRLLGARTDVPDLLAAADVVVSTAVWEGQPIGIQEALHAGAAIVATDAGGTRKVTGVAGAVIVPVGSSKGLAREIRVLLDDGEARRAQGKSAKSRAYELPKPADMAQQVLHAYGWLES